MANERMTASKLKYHYEMNQGGLFFSRANMKFSGDTMSNYYVPAETVNIKHSDGSVTECYELQRRRPVKHGLSKSAYFSVMSSRLCHGEPV